VIIMGRTRAAFTLIELIVVMAIVSMLLALAVPRYFRSVERAKEATLKQDLSVMRDALDKYYGDAGKYPDTLEELVAKRYLRKIPPDPLTDRADSWQMLPPPTDAVKGRVYNVRSGAEGMALDGTPYGDW
jgi:general secretion pathway protein G